MTMNNSKCDATINGFNDCTNDGIYKSSVFGNFCQPCYEKIKEAENWLYDNYTIISIPFSPNELTTLPECIANLTNLPDLNKLSIDNK